jgi:hypothetical protein
MAKVIASLSKLIGRIRKMLANMLIQLGVIFVPLGFTAFFFSAELLDGWRFYVCGPLSIVIFLFGFWCIRNSIKWARLEDADNENKFKMLMNEVRKMNDNINGLVNEIRKDRNGSNDSDNRTGNM